MNLIWCVKNSCFRETTQKLTQIETTEAVDSTKMLAPNFVRVCADRDVTEGKMTRFDCRVTGRPYPEVAWFINGRQVADDATHKILVNESGNHALMITNVSRLDHGAVTCIARNKAGETSFQVRLSYGRESLLVLLAPCVFNLQWRFLLIHWAIVISIGCTQLK